MAIISTVLKADVQIRQKAAAWSLVVAANNEQVLRNTLLASPGIDGRCQVIVERDASCAGRAYNRGLDNAKSDIVVFAHQDVFLPANWFAQLQMSIDALKKARIEWGVLGVFGATEEAQPALRGFCYSTGLQRVLGEPFTAPIPAQSLDELVLVVRRSSGLRFDDHLPGFHLYGTDICLRSRAAGLKSFIVPAFCIHNSNGIVRLPREFWDAYLYLRRRWRNQLPIVTCCTKITKLAVPMLTRRAHEWKERVRPRKVGRRQSDVAELYQRLCREDARIAAPPQVHPPRVKIGLMGATLETPNLGVSVLATGAVTCVTSAFPEADVFFLDYARESRTQSILAGSGRVDVRLVNMRFSKRFWLRNNIVMLLAAALLFRLIPARRVRSACLKRNPWLAEICSAEMYGAVAGGDSFSDLYGAGRFLYVALPQILVLLLGKRLVLLPQTYGPFRRGWTRAIARQIVNRAEQAWCRDHESLAALASTKSEEGVDRFRFDVGFGIESQRPAQIVSDGLQVPETRDGNLIGVNVSGLLFRSSGLGKNEFQMKTDYADLVRACVEAMLSRAETKVLLVPHVYGAGADSESDEIACQAVYEEFKERYANRLGILRGTYGPNEVRYVIGRCGFFVGSRMHACIAAVSQCIPAVSIAYSDKFLGVMRTVGVAELVADPRKCSQEEILGVVERSFLRRAAIEQKLQATMPRIRQSVRDLLRAPMRAGDRHAV